MTNREELIALLQNKEYETDILATSFIECPYTKCENPHKYGTTEFQIYCDENCKLEWLDKECGEE